MVALKICSIDSREKGKASNNRPARDEAGEYERKDRRERERRVRAEGTGRGRMEIAQACNKSRYRSMISPECALPRVREREREERKGKGTNADCEERGQALVGGAELTKKGPIIAAMYTEGSSRGFAIF